METRCFVTQNSKEITDIAMLHKWIHLGYYLISVLSGLVIPADQVIARYITGRLLSMVCAPYPGKLSTMSAI